MKHQNMSCMVGCKTMQGTNHQAYEVQWGNIISCLLLGLPLLLHLIIIIAKKKLKGKKKGIVINDA
jgi:hypothetical protein